MTHPLPPLVAERLAVLRECPTEPTDKGPGLRAPGPSPAELARTRPAVHAAGFSYPLLTLREPALAGNLTAMAAYCAGAGVELAPHGKTAMSPELAARQLASGAWGITVATIGQLRAYRAFGFPRLLLANELVDEAGIAWLADELAADRGFVAYCYVDSTDGVAILDRVLNARPPGRRLPVLVEIGLERTGCRTDDQALAVAKAAAATSTLTVAGVAGYEGAIGGDPRVQAPGPVTSFCRRLANAAGTPPGRGHAPPGRRQGDRAQRPACLPAAGPGYRAGARRPGVPGHLPPVHHAGQVAGNTGAGRAGPHHRRGAHVLLGPGAAHPVRTRPRAGPGHPGPAAARRAALRCRVSP